MCTRFGCSFLVRALYVHIFQLGFCMAQRAYSCTLKKGYARNVCAFTNYDTLTCLPRVLTFSYYHWCHASTELCLFFCHLNRSGYLNRFANLIWLGQLIWLGNLNRLRHLISFGYLNQLAHLNRLGDLKRFANLISLGHFSRLGHLNWLVI